MYAQPARTQSGSRSLSLGAALAINGALIAGIISAAPDILPPEVVTLIGRNIPLPQPTPEITPAPLPTAALPQPQPRKQPQPQPSAVPDASTTLLPGAGDHTSSGSVIDYDPPVAPPIPIPTFTTQPVLVGAQPDPRYAGQLQPPYPPGAMRMGEEGEVSLRVLIGADGRVKAVERIAATNDSFWEATRRQALARWRFKPATRDGVAVESWFTTRVRFVIE